MKGFSILSLNVRSLYPKLDELYIRFKDFDILCFSETWTNPTYTDEMLALSGYDLFRSDRDSSIGIHKRGGGLIIYVKTTLSKYTTTLEYAKKVTANLEQIFICIDKPNVRKQIIGNVYRPPNGKISEGIQELTSTVKIIQETTHCELTVVGDFNINYNLRHTQPFKLIKNFERDFNLSQEINTSTRVTKNSSTCIDLVFTNMEYVISKGTIDIHLSDHRPVFIIKKKQKETIKSTEFWGRSYTKYNKQDFQNDVRNHNGWNEYWEHDNTDPGNLWDIALGIILEGVDTHCPNKKMKFRDDSPPWITKDMVAEITHKDYLYTKAKLSDSPNDWNTFRQKKNEIKKLLQSAKEEFIKDKLDNLKDNPRKFWRDINEMSGIGKNVKRKKGCTKVEDENGTVHENQSAADFMNNYYVNVGPSLAKEHDISWDKTKCKIKTNAQFTFDIITEIEVNNLVKEIKITKSSAIEGISSRLLKDAFEVIIPELSYLYNGALQHGIFPHLWGISQVTPIPKTNLNSKKPTDWRPISQIPLPGKLLEKIVHGQLYRYLNAQNLLSNRQYGFRKGLSTSIAIFDVLKELYDNWNGKEYSGCVFIDFSKAFDTIDHHILFQKLELYGLNNKSLDFFKSYMQNRTQTTSVNGYTSTSAPITYGTAQGSILGPLIFILYVNDVFESVKLSDNIYMYADDTLIISKDDDIDEVTRKCSEGLNKVTTWS